MQQKKQENYMFQGENKMAETKEKITDKKSHVSDIKIKAVKELAKAIEGKNTILFASIKNLPAAQFQKIKKELSKEVIIKIIKKRALKLAIEMVKNKGVHQLNDYIKEDIAIMISDMDCFDLSKKLAQSKTPVKAKTGQKAECDIEVEAGETDLPAGPAVSELSGLGLQVMIKAGKIEIRESRVIVKKDHIISEGAASIMAKLNILPFSVGFIPLVAYDSKSDKIYTEIIIDSEATLKNLKDTFMKSKSFAVNLGYICEDTIKLLIAKAGRYERVINELIKTESAENSSKIKKSSESSEQMEEVKNE